MKVLNKPKKKNGDLELNRFRKKEKIKKLKIRTITKKKADVTFLSIVGLILLIITSGVVRMFTMADEFDVLRADMTQMQSEARNIHQVTDALDMPLVAGVMDEFIPLWVNVDLSNRDVVDERLTRLAELVSFDIDQVNMGIPPQVSRSIYSMELISMREAGSHHLASYEVVYHINDGSIVLEIDEQEAQDNDGDEYPLTADHEVRTVINVPFVIHEGLIAIVSQPYFTAQPEVIGETDAFTVMMENNQSDEMREVRPSLEQFLPVFFELYANSDESQLALFMADVVLMGGNFELVSVDVINTNFAFVGDDVMVQTMVTFTDNEHEFLHTVPFTLVLEEQANSWFVVELHHLFVE